MVKCGPWTPKWIVNHKTNMRCVELELKKKIKGIHKPCCVGVGTYVPQIIMLNFNHPVKELEWDNYEFFK
jgi:hypothetical protein